MSPGLMTRRSLLGAATVPFMARGSHALDNPIRIGVLNDQTGTYADFGGRTSVVAAHMAVEDAGGRILGRVVEVIDADHQNKADVASAIASEWFDRKGVSAITDLTNSAVALAVQAVAGTRGKITLFTGPATTRLTNEECSPTGFHWVFDTYSQAAGTAKAVVAEGGRTWFLLVADYAFGHQLAQDIKSTVEANGGKVLGQVKHPLGTSDFSSFLVQARDSGAQVIGLANGGTDFIGSMKQAGEFRLTRGGQKIAGMVVVLSDIHALGLAAAQGLTFTTAFYWDDTDATRAWSRRFMARTNRMPGMVQAGTYSAVAHYLRAMQSAGTDDGPTVAAAMRATPVDDFFARGTIRIDGRLMHDFMLAEVKGPNESAYPWDYEKLLRRIPAEEAAQPLSMSKCKLVHKA
jgi:branched-chain amino acid transport system substrate-binding protein